MNDSIKRISLDLHRDKSRECVKVKKSDTGRKIYISLVDGGRPYRITEDCYAVFTGKKPDGNILFNDCTIEGNVIVYKLTEQTTAVPGLVNCEIKLYGADSQLLTSSVFSIMVDDTVYDEGDEVESTDEFNALTKLVSEVQSLKEPFEVTLTFTESSHSASEIYAHWLAGGEVRAQNTTIGCQCELYYASPTIVNFRYIQPLNKDSIMWYVFAVNGKKQVNTQVTYHNTPSAVPNPNAITFTGAVEASYDGSEAVNVNIPDTVSPGEINTVVNNALAQAKASGEFDGAPGEPGKTPAKGVDYFTPEEVQEIAEQAAELVDVPEGGGASAFVVNAAYDSVYDTTTIDKTSAEIEAAYKSGKNVICEFNNDGSRMILQPVFITNFASFFYGMYENTLTTVELLHGELNIVVTRYTTQAEFEEALGEISLAFDAMLPKDELDSAINAALAKAKASGEFNGADGQNGADGYTPVRGTDYWTEADKAEIKGYVDTAILGGAW